MIIGVFTLPVFITIFGIIFAIISSILSMNNILNLAIIFFMVSGLFDLFDGMVARKVNKTEKEKLFGIQIDSLADCVSFGVIPCIIAISIGMISILDYFILSLFIINAVIRLSYFNYLVLQNTEKTPIKYYTGLPVTYTTIIIPFVIIMNELITQNISLNIIRITYFLIAILFVLKIKIPKPKGIWYVIFPLLTLIFSVIAYFVL